MTNQKGFTIIELLVVISIIGMLSSVVLVSVNTVRARARDSFRISTLRQIQNAIEIYAVGHNGEYPGYLEGENTFVQQTMDPNPADGCSYGAPGTLGSGNSAYAPGIWCRFETTLSPYISSLPKVKGGTAPFYNIFYKVPYKSLTYNPNKVRLYGLGVMLEKPTAESQNDGGFYPNYFELGELPRYCKDKGSTWVSWTAVPCSCTGTQDPPVGCTY